MLSNIGSNRFTISWTSATPQIGMLRHGTTPSLGSTAYDNRGETYEGTTHYITVTGLKAETIHYYDIISGGSVDDNSGKHYTVKTGPMLSPPFGSDIAYGRVFLNDGFTPAEGRVAYIRLSDKNSLGTSGDSQVCSSLVDADGYWYFDLKNARTQTLDSYFDYSQKGDNLILEVESPDSEFTLLATDTSEDSPVANMVGR